MKYGNSKAFSLRHKGTVYQSEGFGWILTCISI